MWLALNSWVHSLIHMHECIVTSPVVVQRYIIGVHACGAINTVQYHNEPYGTWPIMQWIFHPSFGNMWLAQLSLQLGGMMAAAGQTGFAVVWGIGDCLCNRPTGLSKLLRGVVFILLENQVVTLFLFLTSWSLCSRLPHQLLLASISCSNLRGMDTIIRDTSLGLAARTRPHYSMPAFLLWFH
jgi:hypothetical protein